MKKIAITMGEPGGVGPEVIVKALASPEVRACCDPFVIGDAAVMRSAVKLTRIPLDVTPVTGSGWPKPSADKIRVVDMPCSFRIKKGAPDTNAGIAVVSFIRKAVDLALRKRVHAVVTGPVSKESLSMAGHTWPGHTELLAELTGARSFGMMFYSEKIRLMLVTIHVPLKEVPGRITKAGVLKAIRLAKKGMRMCGIRGPRIAVAGLNPHAGEAGIMGCEEIEAVQPAVGEAKSRGWDVSGPYPPDVVFFRAYRGDFDIVVCMYHDQGLIPFKMLSFETGVNMTVGLPVIRTSPDHGTAFDRAWKNRADPGSMIEAIKLAARLRL